MISKSNGKKSSKTRSRIELFAALVLTVATLVGTPLGVFAHARTPASTYAALHSVGQTPPGMQRLNVYCDGMLRVIEFADGTVAQLLNKLGITLGSHDRVLPSPSSRLAPDMTITVTRAEHTRVTVDEVIPRATVYIANEYLPRGTEMVIEEGNDGVRRVDYEMVTCGKAELPRRAVAVSTITEATDRVIEYGPGGTIVTDDGKVLYWSHKIDGSATAYTTEGYRQKHNALGRVARTGTIAVDPKVIPLKSSLYVEGATWSYGECVAEDTGGAVKGTIVDLFFNTVAECYQFGRRYCTIYVLTDDMSVSG